MFLIYPKNVWLNYPVKDFRFTEEEIQKRDDKNLIGTRHGVDCYLSENLTLIDKEYKQKLNK